MYFRFFRRMSIAPGLKLNLTKRGASFSAGPKGAKYTVGTSGRRATLGIPGTGLFYTGKVGGKKQSSTRQRSQTTSSAQAIQDIPPESPEQKLTLSFLQRIFTPTNEKAFIEGCKAFVQGNTESAYSHFKNANNITDASFITGLIALKKEQFRVALKHFTKALSDIRNLGKYFGKYQLDVSVRLPITEETFTFIEPDRRGLLLALVDVYQELGQYQQSADCLKRLKRIDPEDIVVKLSTAELLWDTNPNSKSHCKQIVRLAQGIENNCSLGAALLFYRGKALGKLGLFDAARDSLTKAFRRKKDRPDELLLAIQYERALVYEQLGRKKRARNELEKVYAKSPDYEDVAQRLGL